MSSSSKVLDLESIERAKPTTKKSKRSNNTTSRVLPTRTSTVASKSNIKRNELNIGSRKKPSEGGSSKIGKAVASICILLGVGYFVLNKDKGKDRPRGVASNSVEKNAVKENYDERKDISYGKIEFENFDKYNQKVFLNGEQRDVDVLGFINKIPFGDYYLRIEADNYKSFVELISINERGSNIKIKIPKMKVEKFGYLTVSQDCFKEKFNFCFLEKTARRKSLL